ncbi:DMT family transporter [Sulfitobacter mediterraneus]|nr:DMT family transporter [Sulfitobacter mediterraneus]MBM1641930.1 DMT family transporter [Sulfitobacter mediterraneus]MBM1645419.1 DMT family transporter [Sulfitobacter mediterraneus]MBM1650049.1 DMT family transporter [Sulfitobacter mediterraneus]MBM1653488.1 DMT family transporter [Sulfitobacter mediterraneus]
MAALGVLFASVCFGIVPYFSRNLTDEGLAAHSVAFYRYIITAVILLPAFLSQLKAWRELVWGLCAGAGMGLGWIGYVGAVETIPASTVGVLYMTYPVFTVVIAWAMFADPPSRKALLASGLIFLAAIIAGNPAAVPSQDLPTLIFSLAAPLGFGFGICVLVHRLSRIPPLARIASVSLGSVLALSPLVATSTAAEILPADADTWIMILGIAVVSAFVPQLIYTVSSPIIGASRTAVIGSVELPTMFLVGMFAFGETLTFAQLSACALVITAIVLTRSRATRNVTTNIARTP